MWHRNSGQRNDIPLRRTRPPDLAHELRRARRWAGQRSGHYDNTYFVAPYSTNTCDTAGECRHGQIEGVTGSNGVVTGFDYDIWGQLALYGEGTTDGGATFIYQLDMTNDSASRTVETCTSGTASRVGQEQASGRMNRHAKRLREHV